MLCCHLKLAEICGLNGMPCKEVNKTTITLLFNFKEYNNKLISDVRGYTMNTQFFILGMKTKIFVFTSVHNGPAAHPVS